MTNTKLPRGIRNSNPGNIEHRDPWQGLVPPMERKDKRFAEFINPVFGIRAIARTLITYQDRHGIHTVEDAIARWAPDNENNTLAYQNVVAKAAGVSPNQVVDFQDYNVLRPVVEAIIKHENGVGPLKTANTWYGEDVIDEAMRLAGIVKPAATVAKLPVTKEAVGATATGALGAAQLAEVAPQVMHAIERSDANLSSGSIVRIVVGVLTIAVAVYIAWSQVKKHESGVVA